jgi:hypothetical protein
MKQVVSRALHVGFFLGLFFDLADGGDVFLRNVGYIFKGYTALYPIRHNAS